MGDAADDAEADPPPATAAKRAASYASKSAKQQKRNGVPDDFFVYGNRYRLEEPSNAFRELKYGPGVQAKHWRDQDKMVSTSTLLDPSQGDDQERARVLKKLKPDLFGTGVAQSLAPLDSYLTAKEGEEEAFGEQPLRPPHKQLELQVIVRLARRSLNYCTGLPFDGLNDDHVANLNAAVSAFFNGVSHATTPKKLTKEEVICWVFHELPLTGHTCNSYPDAMASYQRNTRDVLDMLSSESVFYTQQTLDEECIEMLVGLRTVVLGGIGPVVKNEDEEWSALPPLPARPRPESAVPTHGAMRIATPRPAAPRPAHCRARRLALTPSCMYVQSSGPAPRSCCRRSPRRRTGY
jgi:hypothetical protein